MRKQDRSGAPGSKGGRRPTVEAGAAPVSDRGRWSSRRKMEVVLRLLRGEDMDAVSRELRVTAARLAQWRDEFLSGGQGALNFCAHAGVERHGYEAKGGNKAHRDDLPETCKASVDNGVA